MDKYGISSKRFREQRSASGLNTVPPFLKTFKRRKKKKVLTLS